ncbi:hypothetical protein YC2023_074316 [Brassica napus]
MVTNKEEREVVELVGYILSHPYRYTVHASLDINTRIDRSLYILILPCGSMLHKAMTVAMRHTRHSLSPRYARKSGLMVYSSMISFNVSVCNRSVLMVYSPILSFNVFVCNRGTDLFKMKRSLSAKLYSEKPLLRNSWKECNQRTGCLMNK